MKYFAALALMAGLVAGDGHLAGEAPQHAAAATTTAAAAAQHTTAAAKVEAPQHVQSAPPAPAAASSHVVVEAPKHVVVESKPAAPAAASTHVVAEAPKHSTAAVASMSVGAGAHVAGVNVHTVVVGGVKPVETGMAPVLSYQPESIEAKKGDKVKFVFMQKNHTVTQSTFADPCKKMDGGMDSGFMPNAEGKSGVEWEMEVTTEEPLWFYCKQQAGFHCAKGMVFAINAAKTGDKTFSVWKQLAISKNGTQASLSAAPLASVGPNAAAKPSTVTVVANGGSHAAVTQAAGHSTAVAAAPSAAATIAHGVGKTGNGDACNCQCLCGMNSFPAAAAQGHFGGFAGMLKP